MIKHGGVVGPQVCVEHRADDGPREERLHLARIAQARLLADAALRRIIRRHPGKAQRLQPPHDRLSVQLRRRCREHRLVRILYTCLWGRRAIAVTKRCWRRRAQQRAAARNQQRHISAWNDDVHVERGGRGGVQQGRAWGKGLARVWRLLEPLILHRLANNHQRDEACCARCRDSCASSYI
jgi:hypothetical protein